MLDRLERTLRDLRISVTDRCNLRCRYCMPREIYGPGFAFLERDELLSFEEITRLAECFARVGVSKIRLTGGEPLLRRNLPRLVEMLAHIDGITDIALTTNGLLLAGRAQRLSDAGLSRVTVSLDALRESTLQSMSDTPISLERVLGGIEDATAAGLAPIKINMVVRRGVNEDCVIAMAEHFRRRPQILRFIEYMDVGSTNGWCAQEVVPSEEIVSRIHARWPLEPLTPLREGEVAARYRYRDGAGEIGLISSITKPFCDGCARARLSADGKLFTCLFARRGHDLRALLRGDAHDGEVEQEIQRIWGARADRYSAERMSVGGEHTLATEGTAADRSRTEHTSTGDIARAHAKGKIGKVEMSYIGG